MSETLMEIFLEGAEEYGWLDDKFVEKKKIARKLLLLGVSVEKVAEATELPIETVNALCQGDVYQEDGSLVTPTGA